MGIPLLVRSPVLTGALRPFWVSLRTPFARPLRPLCTGFAPLTKTRTEDIYPERNGDLGQSE